MQAAARTAVLQQVCGRCGARFILSNHASILCGSEGLGLPLASAHRRRSWQGCSWLQARRRIR